MYVCTCVTSQIKVGRIIWPCVEAHVSYHVSDGQRKPMSQCVCAHVCVRTCHTMQKEARGPLQESPPSFSCGFWGSLWEQALGPHSYLCNRLGGSQPGAWWTSSYAASWPRSWWHLERCRPHQESHTAERQSEAVRAHSKVTSPAHGCLLLPQQTAHSCWPWGKPCSVCFPENPTYSGSQQGRPRMSSAVLKMQKSMDSLEISNERVRSFRISLTNGRATGVMLLALYNNGFI